MVDSLDVVWLHEFRCFAFLMQRHAHYSIVRFNRNGWEYEVQVENDDYDLFEERATDIEPDEQ